MLDKDIAELELMASQHVRGIGIDANEINSDTIDDRVHPAVFGEALMMARFESYEAAEISDVIHEAIAETYWKLVDEANGLTDKRDHDETLPGSEALEDISYKFDKE